MSYSPKETKNERRAKKQRNQKKMRVSGASVKNLRRIQKEKGDVQ